MFWAIYVSDKPHSKINFPIGMNNGIWGVHDSKKKHVVNVKEGDLVAFVYSISWLKAEGPPPPGFSRVSKEKLHLFRGVVQSITIGRVSRSYYESNSTVWPDDTYPHRFEFEVIEKHQDNLFFGTEFFNHEFVEAVRYSACTQGSLSSSPNINTLADIYSSEPSNNTIDKQETPSFEGKPIYKLHKSRERDHKLVKRKKAQVLSETGKLACEVCDTDFSVIYGALGDGFAECHHKNPISLREANSVTRLEELAILCANCHRMIHRKKPWLSIDKLKDIYASK